MSRLNRNLNRVVAAKAKSLVYTPRMRSMLRKIVTSNNSKPLWRMAENAGFDGHIRRLTAETLPRDKYFAKLTIPYSEQIDGEYFKLFYGDDIVYGNVVKRQEQTKFLEYRNFIVDSSKPSDFTLNIDTPYTLHIGRGSFSNPQQVAYDKSHAIEQFENVFYSLRGNIVNPKRLLLMFPDFSDSASRISYPIEYFEEIAEEELSDTLVVSFQDCYMSAGTYMAIDNSGRSLSSRVISILDRFISRYDISEEDVMLFGVSKGGSIAIRYSEHLPQAHLVVVAPHMNIPYALRGSFVGDNPGQLYELGAIVQPDQQMRTAFRDGRTIDYFYSDADEQSNCSLVELVDDIPGLSKFRIAGDHDDVVRSALPAVLNIVRRFLGSGVDYLTETLDVNAFSSGDTLGLQVRIDDSDGPGVEASWYVDGLLGRTSFRQNISDHALPFVKFTSELQRLRPELDDLGGLRGLIAYAANGDRWRASFPNECNLLAGFSPRARLPWSRLQLNTNRPTPYVIVKENSLAYFTYECMRALGNEDRIDVYLVEDIVSFDLNCVRHSTGARYVASVTCSEGYHLLSLLIQRFKISSLCSEVRVYSFGGLSSHVLYSRLLENELSPSTFDIV